MSGCPFANIMEPTYLGNGFKPDDVAAIRAAGPAVKIEDPATGVPYWAIAQYDAIDYVSKPAMDFWSDLLLYGKHDGAVYI